MRLFKEFDLEYLMREAMRSDVREAAYHLFQTDSVHVLVASRPISREQQGHFLEVTTYPDRVPPTLAIDYLKNQLILVKKLHDLGFTSVVEGASVISELRISLEYPVADLELIRAAIEQYVQDTFWPL